MDSFETDLFVIGGGSGGVRAARIAAGHGARVMIAEEYRMGGVLYMVKVNPVKGTSYYLVDSDGDGSLETRYSDRQSGLAIPAWVLLRW